MTIPLYFAAEIVLGLEVANLQKQCICNHVVELVRMYFTIDDTTANKKCKSSFVVVRVDVMIVVFSRSVSSLCVHFVALN